MGAPREVSPPRVVLDTNVVLSALLFGARSLAWLRSAWQAGRIVPLASRATATELIRVLHYPKFELTGAERDDLLADYLPYCEAVTVPPRVRGIPHCRDPADIPFLRLAVAGKASWLVTGDADLLALAPRLAVPIVSPARFRAAAEL